MAKFTHTYTYQKAPAINPLKGFVAYSNETSQRFDRSLEFFYLPLNALMTDANRFNFSPIEQQLNAIQKRGNHAVFRVYLDYPGLPSGLPHFLSKGEGAVTINVKTMVDDADQSRYKVQSPNYENPKLKKAISEFIRALGSRYDGDPRIGFIQLGLLGFWGEWHTYPFDGIQSTPNLMASKTTQMEIYRQFDNAFSKTKLLARYPNTALSNHNIGYHDDSFAVATLPKKDWHFLSLMSAAKETNKWKTEPIGGEIGIGVQSRIFNRLQEANNEHENFFEAVYKSHVSWLLTSSLFTDEKVNTQNASTAAQAMGYEFYIEAANIEKKGNEKIIAIQLKNTGVAPFYYPWTFQIGILNSQTKAVLATSNTSVDITKIMPGESIEIKHRFSSPETGVLACRIKPNYKGAKPLIFANKGCLSSGWFLLDAPNY